MKTQTHIYSIFGQIEEAVASAMIADGSCSRIEAWDIPASALYNDAGQRAKFAIVMPAALVGTFERRIWDLRQ